MAGHSNAVEAWVGDSHLRFAVVAGIVAFCGTSAYSLVFAEWRPALITVVSVGIAILSYLRGPEPLVDVSWNR